MTGGFCRCMHGVRALSATSCEQFGMYSPICTLLVTFAPREGRANYTAEDVTLPAAALQPTWDVDAKLLLR